MDTEYENLVLILDTETTGQNDPEMIEAAWISVEGSKLEVKGEFVERYKPSKPIELGAMSVHHIMDEDLVSCPSPNVFKLPPGVKYLVGHNIDYDWGIIGKPDIKRICTYALAKKVWPNLDSHKLTSILYHTHRFTARHMVKDAHSALTDVHICRMILLEILKETNVNSWGELWQISEKARIPTVMPFGKHKGVPISSVPSSYKKWLMEQPNVDEYLIKALNG